MLTQPTSANQSSTQSRNNCSTDRCHWSTAGGCGQVLKYEHTDIFLFIGTTRISQESQNRSTDIGRGTVYLSDLHDQALDYKKRGKKSQSHYFLNMKYTSTHRPSHSDIHCTSSMWPRKQNYVQKTPWSDYHFFMTLYCINQAGSCLEAITMTKIRYARTATSGWPQDDRRTGESGGVRWNPTHSEHTSSHLVDVSRDVSRQSSDWEADRKDVGECLLKLKVKADNSGHFIWLISQLFLVSDSLHFLRKVCRAILAERHS